MSNWLHDVHGGQGSQFCPFFHVFNLKRQSALGTLRGSDTFNLHQASTLRSKGIHRHPYCSGFSLKKTKCPRDLWRPRVVRNHQGSVLSSKGTVYANIIFLTGDLHRLLEGSRGQKFLGPICFWDGLDIGFHLVLHLLGFTK